MKIVRYDKSDLLERTAYYAFYPLAKVNRMLTRTPHVLD